MSDPGSGHPPGEGEGENQSRPPKNFPPDPENRNRRFFKAFRRGNRASETNERFFSGNFFRARVFPEREKRVRPRVVSIP
jgi:hypothetical protein